MVEYDQVIKNKHFMICQIADLLSQKNIDYVKMIYDEILDEEE